MIARGLLPGFSLRRDASAAQCDKVTDRGARSRLKLSRSKLIDRQGAKLMKRNMGKSDKVVQLVVAAGVIAAGVVFQSWWGVVGAVPILTALMGRCPPYALLGINTCAASSASSGLSVRPGHS
jgi:uncharacterized membrane protein